MKTTFDIVTYCSKSYIDAFDAHIRSWLNNTSAKHIYIYTDTDINKFKINNSRVIVKKFHNRCDDWIESVGRKTECILDYLQNSKSKYFAFIEMDCYIVSNFEEVFREDIDISITRLFSKERYTNATITCGVWFTRIDDPVIDFMKEWHRLSNLYKLNGIGVCENMIAYDQLSFTDLIRPMYVDKTMKIVALDENIYNCEHSNRDLMTQQIEDQTPKIIHMKGRRFRNKKFVKMIHDTLEGNYD